MAIKDLMARTPAPEPIRSEPPAVAAHRPVPASAPAAPAPTTHLGAGSSISGQMRCGESLRIDGKVKGEIFCDQQLTIGESASVQAAIEGDTVVIAGEVQGDIKAHRKITLERTARVTGDLCTPGIVIQEGAILEGRIMISGQIEGERLRTADAQPATARASEPPKPAPRTTPPPPQP